MCIAYYFTNEIGLNISLMVTLKNVSTTICEILICLCVSQKRCQVGGFFEELQLQRGPEKNNIFEKPSHNFNMDKSVKNRNRCSSADQSVDEKQIIILNDSSHSRKDFDENECFA